MADYTTKYNFKKPTQDEFYNVDDQNGNWDKADQTLSNIETNIENLTAADVGAETPSGAQMKADAAEQNAKDYASTLTAANVGAVPTTRKVNGKDLSTDVTLAASDIKTSSGNSIESDLSDITTNQGDLTALSTTNKSNLVGAMNEVFQNVASGKDNLYSALATKGITPMSKDFADLYNAINTSDFVRTNSATATSADIMSGKTAYVNGSKLTGTIVDEYTAPSEEVANGLTATGAIGRTQADNLWVPGSGVIYLKPKEGYYHTDAWIFAKEVNLISENILSGKSIFGVAGSLVLGRKTANGYLSGGVSTTKTVSGLAFNPSIVIIIGRNGNTPGSVPGQITILSTNSDSILGQGYLNVFSGNTFTWNPSFDVSFDLSGNAFTWYNSCNYQYWIALE